MAKRNKLPGCFFNSKEFMEALMNIRLCYLSGLTSNRMVMEIWKHHEECQDEEHKRIMEQLMTSVYEFDDEGVGRYYAKYYKLFPERTSHSEISYSYHYLKKCIQQQSYFQWLEKYDDSLIENTPIKRSFDDPQYWMVVPLKEKENVITLSEDAGLYCVVEENLTVNLIVMVKRPGKYIIVEEMSVGYPHYLSYEILEDDEFLSPIFRLKAAKKILEYLLARVGYPYIPIRMKVIFTSQEMELVNWSEFYRRPCAEFEGERSCPIPKKEEPWDGIDVILAKTLDPKQGFLLRCPYKNLLFAAKDKYDREMIRMLYATLAATSMIYDDLHDDHGGNLQYTTLEDMKYWSEEFHIFKSSKKQ